MATKTKKAEPLQLNSDTALGGVLALLVADREERLNDKAQPRKTEVVLNDAGLTLGDVAKLTGKNYETVKKNVQNARKKK
jgi:DNA-directed RNA polymerase specialized sigma24 family protein